MDKIDLLIEKVVSDMKLRNFSNKTINNYEYNIRNFLVYLRSNSLIIDENSIKRYFIFLSSKYDINTIKQIRASVVYFLKINNILLDLSVFPRSMRKKLLPKVVSREEIREMIRKTRNLKH